jgi:hypothetical protein
LRCTPYGGNDPSWWRWPACTYIHKALAYIDLQIHHAISDIAGVTGSANIDAILAGERDPNQRVRLNQRSYLSQSRNQTKCDESSWAAHEENRKRVENKILKPRDLDPGSYQPVFRSRFPQ